MSKEDQDSPRYDQAFASGCTAAEAGFTPEKPISMCLEERLNLLTLQAYNATTAALEAAEECEALHARCDEAERAAQEWAEYAQANNEALQAMRAELESLRIEVQSLRAEMPAKLH